MNKVGKSTDPKKFFWVKKVFSLTILLLLSTLSLKALDSDPRPTREVILEIDATVNQTFTSFADIKETLTECCADLQQDFGETWTILADITDSSTICCELLQEDFRQTWTLIEGVQETLCTKFEETWTILAEITDSSTICCELLQEDFRQTWTLIEGVQETLCTKFEQTWTILAALSSGTAVSNLSEFQQTWTILDILTAAACDPTIIRQTDFGTGGASSLTISTSGLYIFGEDIVFNPAATAQAIVITTSNVKLDLCGFTLRQGNATASVDGIGINAGNTDVTIQNGKIQGFSDTGISVQSGCNRITMQDLTFVDCDLHGIDIIGTSGSKVENSVIRNCQFTECSVASNTFFNNFEHCINLQVMDCDISDNTLGVNSSIILLNNCSECVLKNIDIFNNTTLSNCLNIFSTENCIFDNCNIIGNTSTVPLNGVAFTSSTDNVFKQCAVIDNATSSSFNAYIVFANCHRQTFLDCLALNNSGAAAAARGWYLLGGDDHILINCVSSRNNGTVTTVAGYQIDNSSGGLMLNCVANGNSTSGASNMVYGLFLNSASALDWTIKNCKFNNNTNSTTAANSFGIDISAGSNNLFTKNVAFNNSTTPGNQLSGFAGTQKQDVTDTTINSATFPWTNVGVI